MATVKQCGENLALATGLTEQEAVAGVIRKTLDLRQV